MLLSSHKRSFVHLRDLSLNDYKQQLVGVRQCLRKMELAMVVAMTGATIVAVASRAWRRAQGKLVALLVRHQAKDNSRMAQRVEFDAGGAL